MFDSPRASLADNKRPSHEFSRPAAGGRYCGPDRRQQQPFPPLRHWLSAALDEFDYGVLLLDERAEVVHINHAALTELDALHPLQLHGPQLRARRPQDAAPLQDALHDAARRGLRKLLSLGDGGQRVGVSVVPLAPEAGSPGQPVTLLILGKRRVCEVLSVQGFARSHGLTGAETRVLTGLCNGTPPTQIAVELGVRISTVRTQIATIRTKTGATSIRALVRQIAQLPPLVGVLRSTAAAALRVVAERGPADGRPAFAFAD
jgi:DNA-binding CsgD family transcriptional regulator